MEVLGDPLALLDDGQALDLLVQPGVLDGDPGPEREHLDEQLVGLAELGRVALVGQVQVADRAPVAVTTGTPRKECIGGWCGGNPKESGWRAMSGIR